MVITMSIPRPDRPLPARAAYDLAKDPKRYSRALLEGGPALGESIEPFTPVQIARWLLTAEGLSKNAVGVLFAEKTSMAVLDAFVDALDFTAFDAYDEALRFFTSLFRLQGESQQIERILWAFARAYQRDHPTKFKTADVAHTLAFSLMMLNTDAHSTQIKPANKMTLDQFVRNNRGIDGGDDIPFTMLSGFYSRIVAREIQLEQREFVADGAVSVDGGASFDAVKKGWLKKEGGRVKTMHRRWTILSGSTLYYFVTEKVRP